MFLCENGDFIIISFIIPRLYIVLNHIQGLKSAPSLEHLLAISLTAHLVLEATKITLLIKQHMMKHNWQMRYLRTKG